IVLNGTQKVALSVGLKFSIPPQRHHPVNVQTQFECLHDQLKSLEATSTDAAACFKFRLVDLAHQYQRTPISQQSLLSKEQINQLKELLKNTELVILPPDKGSEVVLLNRADYINRMQSILSDTSKFVIDEDQTDAVQNAERQINLTPKNLHHEGLIGQTNPKKLSLKDSLTPSMYGLPKAHNPGASYRPILFKIGSPYHRLAQWLVSPIEPVRSKLAVHSLKDTSEFVELISNINVKHQVITSFDIESLFTNVPLDEVINIVCSYATEHKLALSIPIDELSKLLKMCTSNIELVFNGTCYRQIDVVAMGTQ
ncbi:uncharacterized protein DEA37_0010152, partial [Paragonimus westermani]